MNICETEFLLKNGDPEWLKGIEYAPKKLQNLMELNKILAHRPWLITVDHLKVHSPFLLTYCDIIYDTTFDSSQGASILRDAWFVCICFQDLARTHDSGLCNILV